MRIMKAATETVRQETFQGREFTVVPVIALIEGVMHAANSSQPELIKASEFEPATWNGRPITFGHPAIGEVLVSAAASPEVFEKVAVGTIFNATIINGQKLRVEAWIDNEKVEDQGEEAVKAFERLKAGEAMEVSTGYFADTVAESGKFNGETFEAIQKDIKPDHLAILLGEDIGACSLEDGCGTNRVNSISFENFMQVCDLSKEQVEVVITTNQAQNGETTWYPGITGSVEPAEEKNKNLSKILANLELRYNGEISDMDVRSAISSALEAKGEFFWSVVAVFQSNFVYEKDFGTLKRREYSIAEDGTVSLSDESEIVRPVTEFIPVKTNQETEMSKKDEMIKDLIANEATQFAEGDREFLSTLDETKLGILAPVVVEAEKEGEDEEAAKAKAVAEAKTETEEEKESQEVKDPVTTEEFIAGAPEEIQEVLNQGVRLQKKQRSTFVKAITSNQASGFTEEDLKDYSMEHLEKLARATAPNDFSIRSNPVSNLEDDAGKIPSARPIWDLKGQKVKQAS